MGPLFYPERLKGGKVKPVFELKINHLPLDYVIRKT